MVKNVLKNNYLYLLITFILIVGVNLVMKSQIYDVILSFDHTVINFVSYIINTYFTSFFKALTNFGDWYIPTMIIVCIFIFFKNKKYFYILTSGYAFSGLIALISKLLIQRPRPVKALIDIPKSFSFPSGHTLTSIVFYITLWYLLTYKSTKKTKIITFIIT